MEPINTQISLRPLRLGFLVNPTNRVALSKVMRLTSCMWGGMMCPLIPVMKAIPPQWRDPRSRLSAPEITQGYLRFFEPDIFVETASGQFELAGLEPDTPYRERKRYRSLTDLIRKDHGLDADLDLGVNMYHVYWHLFRTEFQFQKRVKPRILSFKPGDRIGAAFFEAAFGYFPRGKTLSYVRDSYKDAFDAELVSPDVEQWRQIAERGAGYPLYYTVRGIEAQFGTRTDPTIFIFDPLNPGDVIDFWNFRLFTRDVLAINSHWLPEARDTIIRYIRAHHRLLPTNPNGVMIRTALHAARSLDTEAVAAQLKLDEADLADGSASLQGWYAPIWRDWNDDHGFPPIAAVLSAKTRETQSTPSNDDRATLRYPVQAPEFKADQRGTGPSWVNVVRARQYGWRKEIADALPSAALGGRDGYPLRATNDQFVSREGYVTLHNYAHDDSYIELPKQQQAIVNWLKCDGIDAAPSDAGRIADQVILSVGGLGGVNLFAEREVLDLLDKMARSRREWPDGASDEFEDRTAPVTRWIATLNKIQKRIHGRWKTLDRFVEGGVLRLGLAAVCTHCAKENWYSLDDVAALVQCGRCLKSFAYPQGQPQRTSVWKYRVAGPFATPHYAQGSYSVALALRFLEHEIGSMEEFTYSTGLLLKRKNVEIETDFYAWHNRHSFTRAAGDPITLVGECKSLGVDAFKDTDIKRLEALSMMLPGAYIVAVTLKDALGEDEVSRLRAFAKWGWARQEIVGKPNPLIVLTGIDLFGDGPFPYQWKGAGGWLEEASKRYPHVFNFLTLAKATQEGHLGFTVEEMRKMRLAVSRGARSAKPLPRKAAEEARS